MAWSSNVEDIEKAECLVSDPTNWSYLGRQSDLFQTLPVPGCRHFRDDELIDSDQT
jgi:hypothetical protein